MADGAGVALLQRYPTNVQDIMLVHWIHTFIKSVDNYKSFGGWMFVIPDMPEGQKGFCDETSNLMCVSDFENISGSRSRAPRIEFLRLGECE